MKFENIDIDKVYSLTESDLANILANHLNVYISVTRNIVLSDKSAKETVKLVLEEIKNNQLIENLSKPYSEIVQRRYNG